MWQRFLRWAQDNSTYISIWGSNQKPDPCNYWRFVQSKKFPDRSDRIQIDTNEFYILRSYERIHLPEHTAVYCRAMDESLGEMRIHYTGFAHPFFGSKEERDDNKGTPLIFEVRGHNVDVNLAHKDILARLSFYNMSENAIFEEDKNNPYGEQELKLSKYFSDWPDKLELIDGGRVKLK